MPLVKGRELVREHKSNPRKCFENLREALDTKQISINDFSIKDLAESLVEDGREWVRSMDPRNSGNVNVFQEAAGAVDSTLFSNITGQIVYNKLLDEYANEEFVFTSAVTSVSTQFNGEKIPGITNIGDQAQVVNELDAFPLAGVGEDYIETPVTTKRGMIVPVSKEAIFFDRTGLIAQRAGQVGEALGLNKEKRIINGIIDENTTAARYKWRGVTIATYNDNTGTHTWDNLSASTPLLDWSSFDAVELLFSNMTDPGTGEPFNASLDTLICTPQMYNVARRVLNATGIQVASPGYATSANPTVTSAANPVGTAPWSAPYKILTSKQLAARMGTDTTWYLVNIGKAFSYMENWPITVVQAPANNELEFTQDIVLRWKASERGAMATIQPRLAFKATA